MQDVPIVPLDRLELAFAPRAWPFALVHRAEIEANFATLRKTKPALWNGRVLMLGDHAIDGAVLRGSFFETDFASFLAWRDGGFQDTSATNCFAMGALRASDGAYLLGVMGAHTAAAGRIYFPSGTPDPTDVSGDRIDLEGNLMRELAEETGLTAADVEAERGWHAVFAGRRLAMMKVLHARETADELRARILADLARQDTPELSDIRIVRSPADFEPAMPPYVTAFLVHVWSCTA